jgi:hypothetical protein
METSRLGLPENPRDEEVRRDALLTVGKLSRLAPGGTQRKKVRPNALLTVGKALPACSGGTLAAPRVKRDTLLTQPERARLRPQNESRWSRSPGYGGRRHRPPAGRNKKALWQANLLSFRGTICDR